MSRLSKRDSSSLSHPIIANDDDVADLAPITRSRINDYNYEIKDESHTLILINLTQDAFPNHCFESLFKNLLYFSKDCIRLNLTAVKHDESSSHLSILESILIFQKFTR